MREKRGWIAAAVALAFALVLTIDIVHKQNSNITTSTGTRTTEVAHSVGASVSPSDPNVTPPRTR